MSVAEPVGLRRAVFPLELFFDLRPPPDLLAFAQHTGLPEQPDDSEADPLNASGACTSVIVGPHDRTAVTVHAGIQHGIQIRLDPFGAYSLLRMPLHLISNQLLDFDTVLDIRLSERTAAARTWTRRAAVLDTVLARRIARGPQPDRAVEWAWHRLRATSGRARVAALADRIGWTPRRLTRRFRDQVGLPPKTVARIFRFERAAALLASMRPLSDIAVESGYSDQAHLTRELRALTGRTPSDLRSHSFKPGLRPSA
ncbi:hypothetical protein GCM10022254_02070 [Actinomadura meridiana]|uniref:HTH araC/xylS-type domain-containing protein n=1 Tax=Actinomadura meridiana TaxID=559626 RepID=A0ABP8BS07_9ACTN